MRKPSRAQLEVLRAIQRGIQLQTFLDDSFYWWLGPKNVRPATVYALLRKELLQESSREGKYVKYRLSKKGRELLLEMK